MASLNPAAAVCGAFIASPLHRLGSGFRGLGLVILLWVVVLAGCGPTSFLITPVRAPQALREHVVLREGAFAREKIALIDVEGTLTNARDRSLMGIVSDNPVARFKEKLDLAADDDRVKAVVLRINSPGGTVTASDLMYMELRRFRERTGKPVIASMLDVAASGGYYVACAADKIYAHPTTVTGSIGVIMLLPDLSRAMHYIGVDVNAIKSGAMKDAGSPFRELGPEDRAIFQGIIDRMYARFLRVVSRGRPGLGEDRLRAVADGRVFLAPEAQEAGLVDGLGTLHDALLAAKDAADLTDTKVVVVQYALPYGYRANIYMQTDPAPAQASGLDRLVPDWLVEPAPRFMYLWAPNW